MSPRAIGVDIGGTFTKLVLLEEPGTVVESLEIPSAFPTQVAVIEGITEATARWRAEGAPPVGIGVAVPGLVDRDAGRVMSAPNLDVLDDLPMCVALQVAAGINVELDNDANAFGLAEARLGAARGCHSAVCVTVGTGVGGAIIRAGRLWRGSTGYAGEIGRMLLDPDGIRYFEQDVGAGAVVDEYRRLAEQPDVAFNAERIAELAADGNAAARQALALCGKRLGVGLAVLVNLLNPDRIVIGGGVAGAGDWLLAPAREEGRRRAWAPSWSRCEVVAAELGPAAGAIGAALLALDATHDTGAE